MEVKVDVEAEDPHSSHSDTRPLTDDRDPKSINKSLKVTNVHRHMALNNIKHVKQHMPWAKKQTTYQGRKGEVTAHTMHTTPLNHSPPNQM